MGRSVGRVVLLLIWLAPLRCPGATRALALYILCRAPAGQTNCTFCKPGTANAANGTANCPPCANGTYTAATGATACTPCAAGSFANVTGVWPQMGAVPPC